MIQIDSNPKNRLNFLILIVNYSSSYFYNPFLELLFMDQEYSNLFSELSNPIRLKIIKILSQNHATFTELSNKFDLSNSEVSRHISRLVGHGFIQKLKNSKSYGLTPLGEIILFLFNPIDLIFQHLDYFKTHLISDLPESLIRDIDALDNSNFINGTGAVMMKIEEMVLLTENDQWIMTEQPFPFGKAELNVKYIVPPRTASLKSKVENVNKTTEARFFPKISVSILVCDKKNGCIFFPNLKGESDFSKGFFIEKDKNQAGMKFLLNVWEYFWENGDIPKI